MVHFTSLIHIFCGVWTLASLFVNEFYNNYHTPNSFKQFAKNWERQKNVIKPYLETSFVRLKLRFKSNDFSLMLRCSEKEEYRR